MTDVGRLLIDLQLVRKTDGTIAIGLTIKEDTPVFAILLVRGNQVVDVLATGPTPEEACRAALEGCAAPALR